MSESQSEFTTPDADDASLTDRLISFYRSYYSDEISQLAQHYPKEQRSLEIAYPKLHSALPDVADDWLSSPDQIREYAEEALRLYDLPADVKLSNAHVRLVDLPDERTFYPGRFSPSEAHREMPILAVRGEITTSSDVDPSITDAGFECQRCGTMNYIPQYEGFQEPHECQGCERQGPFRINFDQSEFVDAQKIRVAEPPEVAAGEGKTIDCYLEDDLAGCVKAGDRVVINGLVQLEQQGDSREQSDRFEVYLDAESVEIEESDATDIDITPEEREEIKEYAAGEHGDPLEVAAESFAPRIWGYKRIKKAMVLGMVEGSWIQPEDGDVIRGSINVLVLGDPSTGKSKLLGRAASIAPRSVDVSSTRASVPGLLASAVRDDFSDAEWTLSAGAFVKANGGLVTIDELDDMAPDVRAAMLEPMANSKINVSMADINTTLPSRVSVFAVGNPMHGRFDPYQPIPDQFEFDSTLLSRFDLIYTVTDQPDYDQDKTLAQHVLDTRDAEKARSGDAAVDSIEDALDTARDAVDNADISVDDVATGPVDDDLLRKWLALAKDQPAPSFESQELREDLADRYAKFRDQYSDEDSPIPIAARKLEAIVRTAEAAAKIEFSKVIRERHVETALARVRESMKDVGMNEDGEFDTDVVETGTSKVQRDRIKNLADLIEEMSAEYGESDNGIPIDDIIDRADEVGLDESKVEQEIEKLRLKKGWVYEPQQGYLKWVGR